MKKRKIDYSQKKLIEIKDIKELALELRELKYPKKSKKKDNSKQMVLIWDKT